MYKVATTETLRAFRTLISVVNFVKEITKIYELHIINGKTAAAIVFNESMLNRASYGFNRHSIYQKGIPNVEILYTPSEN